MSPLDLALASVVGRALGRPITIRRRTPLSGGSINQTERIDTDAGVFVVKSNRQAPEGFFRAEAEGLGALAASATSLAIPRVIACSDTGPACLVIEYLEPGARARDFDEQLGHGLAALHRTTAARYGFAHDNFCGLTPQPNPWTERWVDFYAASRLDHQVRLASDAALLSDAERALFSRLLTRLPDLIMEPAGGPSLIHGDLWSGNLHSTPEGQPALIDPAVSFGHREADFGMMRLFGGFSPRVLAAYHEAYPLDEDWQERNGLYQLYHLLNHLNLFGRGYHADVMVIARRYD